MIKKLHLLILISVVWFSATITFAEPYSPSCETAIEKISRSQKALVPFQRTRELAEQENGEHMEIWREVLEAEFLVWIKPFLVWIKPFNVQ